MRFPVRPGRRQDLISEVNYDGFRVKLRVRIYPGSTSSSTPRLHLLLQKHTKRQAPPKSKQKAGAVPVPRRGYSRCRVAIPFPDPYLITGTHHPPSMTLLLTRIQFLPAWLDGPTRQ